ncbi:MAG: hypothetical protein M3R66_19940, partial [Actinomycetota bacterium]|nr:hypothetical protein [Actinomycetota bacterium]
MNTIHLPGLVTLCNPATRQAGRSGVRGGARYLVVTGYRHRCGQDRGDRRDRRAGRGGGCRVAAFKPAQIGVGSGERTVALDEDEDEDEAA